MDRTRSKLVLIFSLAAAMVGIAFGVVDNPHAQLEDFPSLQASLSRVELLHFDKGKSDYFELWLTTSGGDKFYLRQPDRDRLEIYRTRLPTGRPLEIHYVANSSAHRVMDVRDSTEVHIPLAELLREAATKRRLILIFAGFFFILGLGIAAWQAYPSRQRARDSSEG